MAASFAVAGRRPADVPELESLGGGVWRAPGARIIDRSGGKRLPIGYDGWADAMGGSAMASADNEMMEQMFALLELGGTVLEPLDLSVVFPDAGVRVDAVWPSAASAWP